MEKVAIIGAGNVGSSAAYILLQRNLCDIVLLDIYKNIAMAKALDISHSKPIFGSESSMVGTDEYAEIEDARIIAVCAGMARKPGMSRADLFRQNAEIVKGVCKNIREHAPDAVVIMVTNPLDMMCIVAKNALDFEKQRIVGMSGILDSARFSYFISKELNANIRNVEAMVIGEHGDGMVPLVSAAKVNGKPLTSLLPKEKISEIVERTRNAGAEIVKLFGTGSAYYAPGAAVAHMIEAILNDEKKLLPCSAYLEGEYGISGIFLCVPVVLGRSGAEKIVEIAISDEEMEQLKAAANGIKKKLSDFSA
ncbi:MAG: malate dehydrogenase [Candidatus Micrarchaeia archaeon]